MSQELLQQYGILLIIVGLTLVLLLLLFLVLRRRATAKRGLRPAAAAVAEDTNHAQMSEPIAESQSESKLESSQTEGSFTFFKKKKTKKSKKTGPVDETASFDSEKLARLEDLEQQMLALRELFRAGDITRSVYIAETKALYDIAQELR